MYREPEHFDVVVAPNMYGDIIRCVAAFIPCNTRCFMLICRTPFATAVIDNQ